MPGVVQRAAPGFSVLAHILNDLDQTRSTQRKENQGITGENTKIVTDADVGDVGVG